MKKIILFAVCLMTLGSCTFSKKETAETAEGEKDRIKVALDDYICHSFDVIEFNYKNHSYLGFRNNGGFSILHDPDCKCLKEKKDELYY